jgi:hypothetical protein
MFTAGGVVEKVTSSAASVSCKWLCILSVSQCKHCLLYYSLWSVCLASHIHTLIFNSLSKIVAWCTKQTWEFIRIWFQFNMVIGVWNVDICN